MGDEPKREGSADFAESLTGVAQWYDSHSNLAPQIEAILAWGLSQQYEHRRSANRLVRAMEGFTGQKDFGNALFFALAVSMDPLANPGVQNTLSPAFGTWLSTLRSRYRERAAEWFFGDTNPHVLVLTGVGHQEEGVGLALKRGDGKSLDVLIPDKVFPEFAADLIREFAEGGGPGKAPAEGIEKLRTSMALLETGAAKAAGK